jgi:hypothetical protein
MEFVARRIAASVLNLLAIGTVASSAAVKYTLLKTVPVPGDGGWDYLTVEATGRWVYILHANQADGLDANSYETSGNGLSRR